MCVLVGSPGIGVTDGYEPLCGVLGIELRSHVRTTSALKH